MAIVPVRNLGQIGIVPDANPFDLPPNAWSSGSNVRFANGRVQRAPVFRKIFTEALESSGAYPVHALGLPSTASYDQIILAYNDGTLASWQSEAWDEVSPSTDYNKNDDPRPWTSTVLQNVVYLNRPDRVPVAMRPTDASFSNLQNWPTDWTCGAIRTFNDFLFAINLQQGATERPMAVAWSDIPMYGEVPGTWDVGDLTALAGDNVLGDATSPLIDGLQLRDYFILYAADQVWRVDFIGGSSLFAWRRLFNDGGILNQNCVVEVDGKHYVFGRNDIYVHDGNTKQSLVNGRCKDYIFHNLNHRESHVSFVIHDPVAKEILFCYKSGDADVVWADTAYCNKAAAFNYIDNTWSFRDLPNVPSGTLATIETVLTYDSPKAQELTYRTIGGTYYDQEDGLDRHLVLLGAPDPDRWSEARLYGCEPANKGSKLALEIPEDVTPPAFVERLGIDLDESQTPITTYKVCTRVYPQISLTGHEDGVLFRTGGHLYSAAPVEWGPEQRFDPATQYKLDVRRGGRYLALRITQEEPFDFDLSGYDADIKITGHR